MRYKTKRIITVVALILICVTATSLIGSLSGGFTKKLSEWSLRDRNPDNLLSGNFTDYNGGDGFTVTSRSDGTLVLNGEYLVDGSQTVTIQTLTLSAGTYTLSGAPKGGNYTYYLQVSNTSGVLAKGDGFDSADGTFTLSSSGSVTVSLVVNSGVEYKNVVIRPVLNEGKEAVDFYA